MAKGRDKGSERENRSSYRGCEIVIAGSSEEPIAEIDGEPVAIRPVPGRPGSWRSALDYNEYPSPMQAAKGLIELRRAMRPGVFDSLLGGSKRKGGKR